MSDSASSRAPVDIHELRRFLLDFAVTLVGAGSQPSRVLRSAQRIGGSLGHEVDLAIFPKHIILSVLSRGDDTTRRTAVGDIRPAPFNFDIILKLNALSWEAWDRGLSLAELRRRYTAIVSAPRTSRRLELPLISCANAAFCRLFGGDATAMAVVFAATLIAFFIRREMLIRRIDHRMAFILAAFVASLIAALAIRHLPTATPEIALGASVRFLIPGVP
ncbi:MAG: threonine/serine exporter family protein, partial [Desulfovibrionaceae bacterium]|nr:threonine/serine exporter family protein [Desulfovibrionaceae bacterium]